jgi:hypothetical protein
MSRPSGDEPVGVSADTPDDHETRRRAAAAGRAAERVVGSVLDKLEGLSLWALEQTAESEPESERVQSAESRLQRARRMAAPLPRNANRLVAGSTYFAFRFAPEALHSARAIMRDTSAFLDAEPQRVEAGGETPEE